jgi:hypothetical protein
MLVNVEIEIKDYKRIEKNIKQKREFGLIVQKILWRRF